MTVMEREPLVARTVAAAPPKAHRGGLPRVIVSLVGLSVGLFVFGFAVFAAVIMRDPALTADLRTGPAATQADGIIVLTGGDYRIVEGAKLLHDKRANHLLISGVNSKASRDDLLKLTGLDPATFDCCVELGYTAQDTLGNAEEARSWAAGRRLNRLIVVTSSYHMPRSLAELGIAMPDAELIPHTVMPRRFRDHAWWVQPMAARLLFSEYVKYLPVAARHRAMRYIKPWAAPTVTADRPVPSHS